MTDERPDDGAQHSTDDTRPHHLGEPAGWSQDSTVPQASTPPAGPPPPPGFSSYAGESGLQGPPAASSPFGLGAPQPSATGRPDLAAQPDPERLATRTRRRFAAGVVAAALVVGGGAGIGSAAVWGSLHDNAVSGSAASTPQVHSSTSAIGASTSTGGSVESVAAKVLPSVVKIDVTGAQGAGSGSGIILSADGQILTNNHVVEVAAGGGSLRVSFNDGSSAPATVLGTDPLTDTALIQATNVSGLTPASIGTSGDLNVGQGVVAVGSPFGLESTVTSGIVSALDRPVDVGSDGQGNSTTYPAIQTDAAINPGNSGGALTDLAGNVVGINASIRTAGTAQGAQAGSIGLGFAIPIDEVLPIVQQMASGQTPTHARLGVTVGNVADQQGSSGASGAAVAEGAVINTASAGSTAAQAGIAAGDVVTKIDDHIITGADSLVATIRSYRPGDTVTVTYLRAGETRTAQLTLDSDAAPSNS